MFAPGGATRTAGRRAMSQDGPADNRTTEGGGAPLRLEEFLPYRLNVVASLASQALSRIYSERYGIGVPEWRVLVTLGQYGVMTGKQIGAHSHMHKTKVSRAVAHLESRKLVARKANRVDKREAFLSLTSAGRAIYEDLAPCALEFAKRLAEVIEPGDRAAFDRALDRLTERSAVLVAESIGASRTAAPEARPAPAERAMTARPRSEEDA
jgi:DNA-binding MarR family transcriptional regulator